MATAVADKTKYTFGDPYTPVDIQPISVAGESVPSRIAVRVKADNGDYAVQGILGKDYQLLPNRKVRDVADDIMSRTPKEYGGFRNLKTIWNGKQYVDYFASVNGIAKLNGKESDELNLGLLIWNSYDGTRKVGFEIFALNPFCTNQYHSRNRFGFFAWRHQPGEDGSAGIDVDDALQGISQGVQNIIAIAPKIGELRKLPLDTGEIVRAKASIERFPQTKWGDVLDALAGEQDYNQFALYQALTNVASHKLSGLSSIDVGSDITDYFLPNGKKALDHGTTAEGIVGQRQREVVAGEIVG